MQILKAISTNMLTWEILGFVCAIVLLCGQRVRHGISSWINKEAQKIQKEINDAVKLEEDAANLLKLYKSQQKEQQKFLTDLKKQTSCEIDEMNADMKNKLKLALKKQNEDTDIHIRLIAAQHQQTIMADILEKFTKQTESFLHKQKKEDMNAALDHLFDYLDKDPEIFTRI